MKIQMQMVAFLVAIAAFVSAINGSRSMPADMEAAFFRPHFRPYPRIFGGYKGFGGFGSGGVGSGGFGSGGFGSGVVGGGFGGGDGSNGGGQAGTGGIGNRKSGGKSRGGGRRGDDDGAPGDFPQVGSLP